MSTIAMFGLPGGSEIFIVLFIILLLFGGKKLPELARSMGKSLNEFKKGQKEGEKPEELDDIEKKEISPTGNDEDAK